MRNAIRLLLECDAVALLPDWQHSRGASIEYQLATDLAMPAHPVEHWLAEAGAAQ